MNKSKQEYEAIIRSSILFSLDRETEAVAYKREALKMVENLYLYMLSINAEKYGDFGLEITETAKRCIKNYNATMGDFLNYFNKAMSLEYRRAISRNALSDRYGGAHIAAQDSRVVKHYIKLCELRGDYVVTQDDIQTISRVTGIDACKVRECVDAYNSNYVVDNEIVNEDGETVSVFDRLPSEDNIEKSFEDYDSAYVFLHHIDEVFTKRQSRQKELLSRRLTLDLLKPLLADEKLMKEAMNCEFFNKWVFERYVSTLEVPTARMIAEDLCITEQSLSRAYKNFIALI